MPVAQERILIIGGSSGMGLALAQRLSKVGAEAFIAGRDRAKIDRALTTLEGPAAGVVADFTDADSLGELINAPAYDGMPVAAKAALFEAAAKSLPVGRTGQAEDLAPAVEMLITSGFATGVLLDIDGGARTPL